MWGQLKNCAFGNVFFSFCPVFVFFSEKHSSKVVSFILDLLCPLIQQSDSVSQELMDILLAQIIEPFKVCKVIK